MMADVGEPLTLDEAAARFNISVQTIRNLIAEKKLRRGWMVGGGKRSRSVIDSAELQRLLEEKNRERVIWPEDQND